MKICLVFSGPQPSSAEMGHASHYAGDRGEVLVSNVADPGVDAVLIRCSGADPLDVGRREALLQVLPAHLPVGLLIPGGRVVPVVGGRQERRFMWGMDFEQADGSVYRDGGVIRSEFKAGRPVPRVPEQVYLGLTQRCNRSCSFCVSRQFDYSALTFEQAASLVDELDETVHVVALTGAGEAMVHPQFFEIADRIVNRHPHIQFKMNTSGVALDRNAERLLDYPIKNITVSLNAGTEETYNRVVGPNMKAVLRGIETLARTRVMKGRSDLHLCLSIVLMNSTLPELPLVIEKALEVGVEEVQGIWLMVNDADLAHESPFMDQERANHWLGEAEALARAVGVRASLPPRFGSRAVERSQLTSLPTSHGQLCVEPFSTAYVRPDGEVLPCPYFERSMGSVHTDGGLRGVWNGAQFEALRRALVTGELWAECSSCCGFNEMGSVDKQESHWIGDRLPQAPVVGVPVSIGVRP